MSATAAKPDCPESCDLLVIGGGINGLGIAADAASRGLSVLVTEMRDWGSGTTSASSRLIHGGLRYLQYGEMSLVRESLHERGLLARQRPHLVRPIQLLIPAYRAARLPHWQVRIGLALYNQLARDPLFPSPRSLSLAETLQREPDLAREGLVGGSVYPDGQVAYPERLCVELAQETELAGGTARSHTQAVRLKVDGSRVTGATLRDELDGREWDVDARLTINAAGPWVDAVNRLLPGPTPRLIGGTWGSHVVLPLRHPGGPRGYLYATARRDGRPFFILPWDGRLLVGTTDVPFQGDPGALQVQDWEIEYLLSETNALFPEARYTPEEVQMTTIGVRPLPVSERAAGAITRRHFLVDHGRKHGIAGLGSVVGGKLTTYRSLAEEVVDWALTTLGKPPVPCLTREIDPALHPHVWQADAGERAARLGLSEAAAARLSELYGPASGGVLRILEADPALARPLAPGSRALAGEALHAVRVEGARTAEDVALRRLMLLPPSPEELAAIRAFLPRAGVSQAP